MKKCFFFLMIIITANTPLIAQTKNGSASFYSSLGIGLLEQSRSGVGEGMGIYGVAIDQIRAANFSNPALLGFYSNTTGYGAFDQTIYTGNQNGVQSSYSDFNARDLGLILPIQKSKLSVGISVHGLSYVNYRGQQSQILPGDTTQIVSEFEGNGGLNALQLGIGYTITKNISIGYATAFTFGSVKSANFSIFEDFTYNTILDGKNRYYSGLSHEIGLVYHKNQMLSKNDRFLAGLTLRLPSTLNVRNFDRSVIISTGFEQPILTERPKTETTLPLSVKFGLAYYLNLNWMISSDLVYENWSTVTSNSTLFSHQDRIRLGAGLLYSPELRTSTNFFTSLSFKLGGSLDTGYLQMNGYSISKMSIHAGLAIPSPFTTSSVDFNIEYGRLGASTNSLVQENIFAMKFVINLSEFMFFKRQIQ
jgi:hypothetical protein